MHTDIYSPFAFIQSIFLLVFILMVFVGAAGGRPDTVLRPLMEIIGQIIIAVMSAAFTLIAAVLRGTLSIALSGFQAALSNWKSSNSRQIH